MFKHSTLAAVLIILGSGSAVSAKSDTSFLTDAIQINLAEIAVGDLAQKNGASDDVKAFGKMLVDDHTASNQKAASLAQANGVTPPNEPKPADKEAQQHLATLSGPEFDREFAKAMVKGHKEAIGKFEAASKGDDDIAKFAQDTLPTLQKHLEQAQSIAGKETAAQDVQPTPSDKVSTARSTEMIGTLPGGALPISEYYKQSVYDTQRKQDRRCKRHPARQQWQDRSRDYRCWRPPRNRRKECRPSILSTQGRREKWKSLPRCRDDQGSAPGRSWLRVRQR